MIILGIGGLSHDFSAALLIDGEVVVAIEDERLARIKHGNMEWHSVPTKLSVEYCLEEAGLELDKVDYIYTNEDLELTVEYFPPNRLRRVPHHLAHAANVFFSSPFERAAIMVIDGHGSSISKDKDGVLLETISMGFGDGNKIELDVFQSGRKKLSSGTWQYVTENSLGSFYRIITDAVGFGMRGQGKLMGLAPFGDDSLYEELRNFAPIQANGQFLFDPYGGIYDWIVKKLSESGNKFQTRANIASAAQHIFEEMLVILANVCYEKSTIENLCYSGGCALNGLANYKIMREAPFEHIYIHPATGDQGLALGAAYLGYYELQGGNRKPKAQLEIGREAYKGKPYPIERYEEALQAVPVHYRYIEDPVEVIARHLFNNEVVAVFQGRSEIGPRALGNRSILADARTTAMRDHINLHIKHRESFRPLAPVVPVEVVGKYFELEVPSPFMLTIAPIKEEYRQQLAGVCHVDNSARLQTVDDETNPFLYRLLYYYGELTGVPILINTSFNSQGEPIVETPEEALLCFIKGDINMLLLGNFLVEKHTPWTIRPEPIGFAS